MIIRNEIIIQRPIEDVFEFLMNFENMPKWNYYILSVTNTSGQIRKGSIFKQIRKKDTQQYRIIELDYPHLVTVETLPPERRILMRLTLFQQGDATRVDDWISIDVPWIVKIVAIWKIKAAVKENLTKLRILLETGEVTLQDGRKVKMTT